MLFKKGQSNQTGDARHNQNVEASATVLHPRIWRADEQDEESSHDVPSYIPLTGCVVLISTGSFAQTMSDADYCQQLSSLYRMFSRAQTANAVAAAAMNECDKGNFSVGSARLEEILTGRRIPLPPRG